MPLFDANREPLDTRQLQRRSTEELLANGILPKVPGLTVDGPPPDAILLSHAHLDHVGLIDRTPPEVPVYATSGTSKMMFAGSMFAGQRSLPRDRHRDLVPGEPVSIGDFRVTAFSVDHSIFGSVALLVEADGKSILYSGDLRLHGRKPGMARSLQEYFSDRELDVLLMEGTHFGFPDGERVTEYELEDEIVADIKGAPSLVLACFSPQHIDRLVAFIRAAIKSKRTFVADAYSAFVLHLVSSETRVPVPGKAENLPVYYPELLRQNTKKVASLNRVCPFLEPARIELDAVLAEPSRYIMVFRESMLEPDFDGELPDGVVCFHSRWEGYLEQPGSHQLKAAIEKADGTLIQAHTSGHILSDDIVRFVESLKPKSVVPVHTFEPQHFTTRLANVVLLKDGEVLPLS